MVHASEGTVAETASALVPIEYAIFYVSSDHDGGPDDHVPPTPDQVVVALPRSTLAIASACSDHEAQATLERWTGEPPPQPVRADEPERGTDRSGTLAGWELRRDLTAELASGPFRPAPIMSAPLDPGVGIPAGGTYRVRLYSRGRRRVVEDVRRAIADLDPDGDDDLRIPRGVEQYLIQLWPAGQGAP